MVVVAGAVLARMVIVMVAVFVATTIIIAVTVAKVGAHVARAVLSNIPVSLPNYQRTHRRPNLLLDAIASETV